MTILISKIFELNNSTVLTIYLTNKSSIRWGEEHFSELVESKRYLMLPADALVSFLSSDRLNAVCESQVAMVSVLPVIRCVVFVPNI